MGTNGKTNKSLGCALSETCKYNKCNLLTCKSFILEEEDKYYIKLKKKAEKIAKLKLKRGEK